MLIQNARIFDGHGPELSERSDILLADGEIKEITPAGAAAKARCTVDAGGRTVMPGLIDNHVHVHIPSLDVASLLRMPATYAAQYANVFLNAALQRGFTAVRDVGGGDAGLARAIEHGLVRAPRFYYAGKFISQTGGHGDFRPGWETSPEERLGDCGGYSTTLAHIVDDPHQVRRAVREELRKGAHCIKIMASGGVISPTDPLHQVQFSEEEIRAAVEECARHETYVSAHCHPAAAARRCMEFGVRCIEHGTLMDRETAQYAAAQGAYVVPTGAVVRAFHEEGAEYGLPPASQEKMRGVCEGAMASLENLRAAGVKIGFGTDLLGPQHVRQCTEFAIRKEVFTPLEILRQATSVNAQILLEPERLGCVREGAYADLLVVDGNPLEDISLLERNGAALPVIIRNGEAVKCELPAAAGAVKAFSWPAA